MKRLLWFFLFSFLAISCNDNESSSPLITVSHVDISKYTGLWYEYAKIPNRFQKKCARNTTASYYLSEDGRLKIINQCEEADGSIAKAEGVAKIADTATCAKLKVSFFRIFGIPVYLGDYWIIGLDDDYRWAVVGAPGRKYGWILSRSPILDEQTCNKINDVLISKGYRPDDFIKTEHSP